MSKVLYAALAFVVSSCVGTQTKASSPVPGPVQVDSQAKNGPLDRSPVGVTRRNLERAIGIVWLFRRDHGRLPRDLDEVRAYSLAGFPDEAQRREWFLDAWGRELQYTTDGTSYEFRSMGQDGALHTADDLTAMPAQRSGGSSQGGFAAAPPAK